jgi:glycosyltransferase involved in cell wall biosynthesis
LSGGIATALNMRDLIVRNQMHQHELLALVDKFVLLTEWAYKAVAANGASSEKLALNRLGALRSGGSPKARVDKRPTKLPILVGYLGRLDRIKGVHDLVRAVASLPSNVPLCAEIRGGVRSEAERRVLNELKILVAGDPRITFAPFVPHAQTAHILAEYDVLCCPSMCLEGGPTVAIESYAVGTPVIGTRIGGLAEMVTDGVNGRLVPPGDWKALAIVLSEMASNPAATIDRWKGALPSVRTINEVANDYLALYTA